jgi:hypothetical protein
MGDHRSRPQCYHNTSALGVLAHELQREWYGTLALLPLQAARRVIWIMSSAPHIEIDRHSPAASSQLATENVEDLAEAVLPVLIGERLLTAQAMTLLIRVDREIREARSQFNQNWFRRLMRARQFAVKRLCRRWAKVDPPPLLQLGQLRRRYHANVAKYLYRS